MANYIDLVTEQNNNGQGVIAVKYNYTKIRVDMRLKESVYYAYLGVLCMLFFARDVLSVSLPLVAFLVFFAIGYVFFDYEHSLAITAILPLLGHGVQTNYIVIVAIVMYLLKFGKGMKLTTAHFIIILLMGFEFAHMVYDPFDIPEYIRYLVQYLYLALIIGERRIGELLKKPETVIRTFIFMATYFMADVLLVTLKYESVGTVLSGDFRFGSLSAYLKKVPSLFDNENMVALFAVVTISLLIMMIYKSRKCFIFKALLILYFTFFGLITASRTFLLCLIGCGVLVILHTAGKSMAKAFAGIAGILAGVALIANVFSDQILRIIHRFNVSDVSSGRSSLFALYNDFLLSNPKFLVFGIGLQGVTEKTGIFNAPHNGTQEVFVCWGIIGLVLMAGLFLCILRNPKKFTGKKSSFAGFFPLVVYFVFIQTIQLVRLPSIFGLLVLLYVCILYGGTSNEKQELSDNR